MNRDLKYPELIKVVKFAYYKGGETQDVYIDYSFYKSENLDSRDVITLLTDEDEFDDAGYAIKDESIKVCSSCFFEYVERHGLRIE